jgi:hypothetical protein
MLNILTYNVCWENMEGKNSGKIDGTQCIQNKTNVCLKNVVDLIKKNRKEHKLDFILLQEQVSFDKYLQHKSYTNYISKSGREKMITLWNKKTVICKSKHNTEFSRGRPIQVLFFKKKKDNNNRNNNRNSNSNTNSNTNTSNNTNNKKVIDYQDYICLINVHCGHDSNNNISQLIKILKKLTLSKLEKNILKKGLMIIGGDFNLDIPISIGKLNNDLMFGKRKFYNENTMSSSNSKDYKMRGIYNIDHILSTDKKAQSTVIKTGKWFSDHYPILVLLEKELTEN